MLHVLWEAVVGLIIGALAKLVMPGEQPRGIIITMVIGIVGSLLATWVGVHLGFYHQGQRAGFFASVLGAVVLLGIYRAFKSGRKASG